MMQIVYDDIIYSLQRSGGISLYWSQLETYLEQNTHLLYPNYEKNIFFPSLRGKIINKNTCLILERFKNITIAEKEAFIFHSSYYRYCKSKNALNITTIYDFIYEYFRDDIISNIHKWQKKITINNADGIICISNSTKNDLLNLYPKFNGLIKVIYLGFSQEYHNINLPKKNTVVFVGGRRGYKNIAYAIKIMQRLINLKLQIIGGGSLTKEEILMLNEYIPNRYEYSPMLSNEELNLKYNEARFLLYPSLYEGFGIPVLEAQAVGCPVVCCNVSSLPEVAGNAAVYITGRDIEEDIKRILQFENTDFRRAIIERGLENCKRFSWKKCAEETYDFYQEVWNKRVKH